MPKMKLTQAAVDKIKSPPGGRVEYWDTVLPGFGLRVSAAGAGTARKTWQTMYRVGGGQVRETLGPLAVVPKVDEARDLARTSMRKAQQGVHPVEERRRREEADEDCRRDTLGSAIDRQMERYAVKRMGTDYLKETRRSLERDVKPRLGSRPIREITRREIRELIEAIVDRGSPSHANHVLAYLRAMLNWAVANPYLVCCAAFGDDVTGAPAHRCG